MKLKPHILTGTFLLIVLYYGGLTLFGILIAMFLLVVFTFLLCFLYVIITERPQDKVSHSIDDQNYTVGEVKGGRR